MIILGLGSNIGNREENINTAVDKLKNYERIKIVKMSSLYETEPIGVKEQPFFLNAVVIISTSLEPERLMNTCLKIESQLGRVRDMRWGPRIIDIDVLVYNDLNIKTENLILPHPRLHERRFVLEPLRELLGDNYPLINGITIGELINNLKDSAIVRMYHPSAGHN